jgi:hypothetical protein
MTTSARRNPQVDLGGIVGTVTDNVNGLIGTLDGLLNVSPHCLLSLPCLISLTPPQTINDLDAAIGDLIEDIEGDDNGVLSTVAAEVPVAIDLVNSIVEDIDTEGTLTGVAGEVTSVISEVQTLLADVEALAGELNVPDTIATVEGRLQGLRFTLTNLLNQIVLKQ